MGNYFDVTIYNTINKRSETIKMESGVTFENKNYRYTMGNDGKLSIFDKNNQTTSSGTQISVTDYQMRTLKSVADNNSESDDYTVLSTDDIQNAIEKGNENTLADDLNDNLKNGYIASDIKLNPQGNQFSAYINNGNEKYSSNILFGFKREYHDVHLHNITTGKTQPAKMEKGVSFENNGYIFRMNNDGLLAMFDKEKGEWLTGNDTLKMTNYQMRTFKAVADNINEEPNKPELILSKDDITKSLNLYREGKLTGDLSEFLQTPYKATQVTSYSNNNAFATYVTNGNESTSAILLFKYGSASDAIWMSDFVHNDGLRTDDVTNNETSDKNSAPKGDISKMKVSNSCLNIIKQCESLKLKSYKCSGGKWTIGYGHTKGVEPGQTITKEQAEKFLAQDIKEAEKAVKKYVKVELTQNQYDALVSFVFNIGQNAFKNSTMLKNLNNGNYTKAANQISRWVYAKGKVQGGLVKRRAAEKKLFLA